MPLLKPPPSLPGPLGLASSPGCLPFTHLRNMQANGNTRPPICPLLTQGIKICLIFPVWNAEYLVKDSAPPFYEALRKPKLNPDLFLKIDLGTWQHPGLVSVHKGHRTQEKLLFQKVKARDAFK